MKSSNTAWKEKLEGKMPGELAREIDIFETEINLRKQGKFDEKLFAETRLRRGAYGQRYDNGQRNDGVESQKLNYPDVPTKGPETIWHAPGMLRIKIPFGGMTADQFDVMADLAEEYSDNIAHVTTRQDWQLHFIHIDDTPAVMRRLASVGITTREACGNSVRNITACPIAGVCHTESFDVTPYANAMYEFLLGHEDTQDFGRKIKIAFSGCAENGCGLVGLHDIGLVGRTKTVDGKVVRGFDFFVGGGLGAVPHQAKLIVAFASEEEILPIAQAVCRVFARLGEKKNRARARIKFVVAKEGVEGFQKLIEEERAILPHDDRWKSYIKDLDGHNETPKKDAGSLNGSSPDGFDRFVNDNIYKQRQEGYSTVTVKLPLGDLTSDQLRRTADISRKYLNDTIRLTVEQNMVLRWVSDSDLPAVYEELQAVGLADSGAEKIEDITACPGTDTCKLGISSSRGLAAELMREFKNSSHLKDDEVIRNLKVKISGCFNSCGQHHVADMGFYGVSRKVGSHAVPHFQVVLGGEWKNNAGSYGLPILAVPSKRIPEVIERIGVRYRDERENAEESFQTFIARIGKAEVKSMLLDLTVIPDFEKDETLYTDWGDPRVYSIGDMGIGECAGEVVTLTEFGLAGAERLLFEAQIALDGGDPQKGGAGATKAMLDAARSLVRTMWLDCPDEPAVIGKEFKERLVEKKLFHDKYAGAKFANYLFPAIEAIGENFSTEAAHQRIEEANLFIEASHKCYVDMSNQMQAISK